MPQERGSWPERSCTARVCPLSDHSIRRLPASGTCSRAALASWFMPDAVVVGAGPNGLVAANLLADRGLDVLVLEAEADAGGAVRSAELVEPGYLNDRFSAFHVLAPVSPSFRSLKLERHGLQWARSPLALAHPSSDGTCPALAATP